MSKKTYYCHTEVHYFADDCVAIEADDAVIAAELFGGSVFDDGADWERPVEVIVAETPKGENAYRFKVTRTHVITDDVREIGEVEIPTGEDEET